MEQSLGNLRSVSRLQEANHSGNASGSNGTRSCRNSLLAGVPGPYIPVTSADIVNMGPPLVPSEIYDPTLHDGSLSEDASLWPPDYVVSHCPSTVS